MNQPMLILDLDETLIYGTTNELAFEYDFKCDGYFIYKRPFVDEFITTCARWYDLAVWTSSTNDYTLCIQSVLFDPGQLKFLWARERCTRRLDPELQEHYWVKDLKKIKRAGFDLKRVLIIDDTPKKLERSYGNLVIVKEFVGDPSDRELPELAKYLENLADKKDFRKIEKRGWRGIARD